MHVLGNARTYLHTLYNVNSLQMAQTKHTGRKQTGVGQGKRATFPHNKGPKLEKRTDGRPNWTRQAANLVRARRD